MRDFSLQKLQQLFKVFLDNQYTFLRFDQYWQSKDTRNQEDQIVLLRHDIDRFPDLALAVAEMEAGLGIRGTFFFRVKPYTFVPDIIGRIAALGHEIGYHYEVLSDARGNYKKALTIFNENLMKLRNLVPVVSVSMHSRPLSPWDNRLFWNKYDLADFGLLGEVYRSINYHQYMYLADSGRDWNADRNVIWDYVDGRIPKRMEKGTDGLINAIKEGKLGSVQLLIHPNRWPATTRGWLYQTMADKVINIAKILVRSLKQSRRCRLIKGKLIKSDMNLQRKQKKGLFYSGDPIGKVLSVWRKKRVLPLIRGELVDIACGDNQLVQLYGKGKGVDITDYRHVDIVLKDLSKLPFENKSIDTVTVIAALNYLYEPVSVLKEIRRILKDDGQLILTMANRKAMSVWHKFRDPWVYRPGYSDFQINVFLEQADFIINKKIPFMFFLNYIYIANKKICEYKPRREETV